MKKNILAVIILALSVINLVLSAVLIFAVVPMANKTSSLVTKVASVIDLELESKGVQNVDLKDRESVEIPQEASLITNLTIGEDGKQHVVMFDSLTLKVNKKSEDYKGLRPEIDNEIQKIQSIVQSTLSTFTYEEIVTTEGKEKSTQDLLKAFNDYFGAEDFIVDVILGNLRYQ